MTVETVDLGLPPDEILECNAGGLEGAALTLSQLSSALYTAQEGFKYGDDPLAVELARRCKELGEFLDGLYLTPQATLTTTRECMACGGAGWYGGGRDAPRKDCEECGTTGVDPSSRTENDVQR